MQLETAEFMAEKMLENKINVIIDTSMVEDEENAKEYINLFLRKFFFIETTVRQPYLVVVEEAEDFCGERGIGTQTTLGIMINIVKKGGKRGIGAMFIAHRPAWVSKGILSQCSNKAIGKIESTDFEALEKYARVPSEVIEKLPTLNKGEFCFVGDWVEGTTFVKVGQVQTTHLGFTPGLIPPSPKELQGVILNLQANLKAFVEKVKPSLPDVETLRKDAEAKAETKAAERIKKETLKLEGQYKDRISTLEAENVATKKRLELVSQSAALSSVAPLNDVMDHPIVRNNLEKLAQRDERAKNLLIKIQRDTETKHYATREELAAFVSASQDSVKRLVELVNDVFHAEAIIGEGRPVQYRSVLQRLYITDVARREIERIEELQTKVRTLETEKNSLKIDLTNAQNKLKNYVSPETIVPLQTEVKDLREKMKLMITPEAAGKVLETVQTLRKKLETTTISLKQSERERIYLERNFKVLKGVFSESNKLFSEVDIGYQKILADKTESEREKQEPIVETEEIEPEKLAEQNTPAVHSVNEVNTVNNVNSGYLKVLAFLKQHAEVVFSSFELSLALGLPQEIVCEASRNLQEITVSENGLMVKETKN